MANTLEQILARHCAPVLMNKKAAALLSLPRSLAGEAASIPALLGDGILAERLGERPRHMLVLIYRPSLLRRALRCERAAAILCGLGYPVQGDLPHMLEHLRDRIANEPGFPHEIGLFLGYPAHDVEGFIAHKGRHYKCCGDWKVYADERRARALFEEFRRCRQQLTAYVERGGQLSRLCADMAAG